MRTRTVWLALAAAFALCCASAWTAAAADREPPTLAFKLWLTKAERGDANAQSIVGFMYVRGQGTPQNLSEGASWLRRSAEQGQPSAQWGLGTLYELGLGVPRDYGEAFRLYGLAAPQGLVEAQTTLGLFYLNGIGTEQDYGEAFRWLRTASLRGLGEAQRSLATLYEEGLGTAQDYERAYMWLSLSTDSATKPRDGRLRRLAEKMSTEEISEAETVARRCLESNYTQCD